MVKKWRKGGSKVPTKIAFDGRWWVEEKWGQDITQNTQQSPWERGVCIVPKVVMWGPCHFARRKKIDITSPYLMGLSI